MIEFPSIGQYRQTIKAMHESCAKIGVDEQGKTIYRSITDPLPIVKYVGTVKLHGSNASIVQEPDGLIYYQSRNRIITPENDNAGFAAFCQNLNDDIPFYWERIFQHFRGTFNLTDTVIIYGEWCCGTIQRNVALTQIPRKQFVIFGVASAVNEEIVRWLSPEELSSFKISDKELNEDRVHCIYDFKTFELTIDFNNPALIQNNLVDLTNQVEKQCPVAEVFGVLGTGEGVVWRPVESTFSDPRFWFKVKGEEHSVSKVKTLAEVDLDKVKNISELLDCILTENRLNQCLDYLREMNKPLDQTSTGNFLSWILNDVVKEESDRIKESALDIKEVNKQVGIRARKWFFDWIAKNE